MQAGSELLGQGDLPRATLAVGCDQRLSTPLNCEQATCRKRSSPSRRPCGRSLLARRPTRRSWRRRGGRRRGGSPSRGSCSARCHTLALALALAVAVALSLTLATPRRLHTSTSSHLNLFTPRRLPRPLHPSPPRPWAIPRPLLEPGACRRRRRRRGDQLPAPRRRRRRTEPRRPTGPRGLVHQRAGRVPRPRPPPPVAAPPPGLRLARAGRRGGAICRAPLLLSPHTREAGRKESKSC